MIEILCRLAQLYLIVILVRVVLSWFPLSPGGVLSSVYSFVFSATEPVLGTVRRLLPPVRMGGMGLDLSPIIVIFGISLLTSGFC